MICISIQCTDCTKKIALFHIPFVSKNVEGLQWSKECSVFAIAVNNSLFSSNRNIWSCFVISFSLGDKNNKNKTTDISSYTCTFELELNFHKLMLCLLSVFDSSPVLKIYVLMAWRHWCFRFCRAVSRSRPVVSASTCSGRYRLIPLR